MQIAKLSVLVEAGAVREVAVSYAADTGGWVAHITYATRNGARTEVLERQRGGWRVFKTIDAAANTANNIGFRRIEVDLSSR